VRLKRDLLVEIDTGKVLLKNIELTGGEYRDFGFVRLRSDGKVRVRLIGVRAKQASEIWWLATNLNLSVAQIVGLYDRRMSIEEQFRDTKGTHFGLKLKWTCFERGEYLERMFLLIGVAMLLWTVSLSSPDAENQLKNIRAVYSSDRLIPKICKVVPVARCNRAIAF
jgi:hypothetical protein